MAYFRRNRDNSELNIWPGFVDALSTVVLVFTFVIVGFLASQIYLSKMIMDKKSSMDNLQSQLREVCSLFDSEKNKNKELNSINVDLRKQIDELNKVIEQLNSMFSQETEIANQEKSSLRDKIDKLNAQLKEVLEALAAEHMNSEKNLKALAAIKDENIKLNKLARFNAYRSEFFEKLEQIVKDKEGIKIVGDRFVFQSELFFDTGSDILSKEGKAQVSELAKIILDIGEKIPSNIRWILRVDGHTDSKKISGNGRFASNWELSAARAISVVKHLVKEGVSPNHLVAAGFGEFQPIATGSSEEDLARNRRIEFKLDER
ncbi:MAG: OmpA family protein [Alphaproteobacteria bacterium]|nr:OmpA family protein [Alphaproteobacteria bacterium]